ncbi:MAG: hypothetical protein JXR96_06400 [Deltaproteobacteria bacterium]|nr:hypothetical protein [Deltaproteobacteria bacterium]
MQLRIVLSIFWRPRAAFGRLLSHPRASVAILLLVGCLWASHWAVYQRVDVGAMERAVAVSLAEESPGKSVPDKEVCEEAQRRLAAYRILGYPAIGVGVLVALAPASLLFYLLLGAWGEGLGFRRCYRMLAHACLPLGLRQLLALPVIFSYPSIHPLATRGLFKTDLASALGQAAFPVASWLDPFWIWMAVLVVLAGRAMGRGRLRSMIVGLVFFGLFGLLGQVV